MLESLSDLDIEVVICVNNELGVGLEKKITETLKSTDVEMFTKCFENFADFKRFKLALTCIERFSQLSSLKYLPNVNCIEEYIKWYV